MVSVGAGDQTVTSLLLDSHSTHRTVPPQTGSGHVNKESAMLAGDRQVTKFIIYVCMD